MPMETELFKALNVIASKENLYVTANSSMKGGVIAGLSALAGGLLVGRNGIALGAAIGGAIASAISEDFVPVTQILLELKPEEKEQLYKNVIRAFKDVGITDVFKIILLINTGKYEYQIALTVMEAFFKENMNMMLASK